jgi:uroporphyrinogen-III synthase
VTKGSLDAVRVVVLRVGDRDDEIAAELRARGADAVTVTVATVDDRPDAEVRSQVGALDRFAWVALTSPNAARRLGLWAASLPSSLRIGAVGPATARAIESLGLVADAVAGDGTAAGLARELDVGPVLFLAAKHARRDLVDALEARGIECDVVVTYDTVPRMLGVAEVDALEACEAVVAASPGGIEAVAAVPLLDAALHQRALVAIGPTTARHARRRGFRVAATASSRDARSVADAVASVVAR